MIKLELLNNADFKNLIKIVDTLEQRIAKLEKVLASHAKCIGEMRDKKDD
jgi:exonuclease VII small subunit